MKSNEITKVRGSKMIQDMYNEYIEVTPGVFNYRVLSDKSNKGGDVSRVKFQKINCDDDQLICRRTLNGSTGRKTGFIKLFVHFSTCEIKYEVYRECIKSCYYVNLKNNKDILDDLLKKVS